MSPVEDRLGRPLIRLALVLVLGGIAPLLDTTIVTVALPQLAAQFHAGVADVQWVTTGYLLALAVTIPVTTWATDRIGGRRLWLLGLALFLAGSVAAGLAWDLPSLVAFRAVTGVGAGILQPVLQTILVGAAGPRKLGRVLTIVTLVVLIGPIAGPLTGGALVTTAGWRSIFFVNVPVCVAAFALALAYVPADAPARRRRLDGPGLLLLGPALVGLIYALTETAEGGGFGEPKIIGPLAVGAALLAVFTVRSVRLKARACLDLSLFRVRSFAAAAAVLFFSGLSLYGAMFLLPLYHQRAGGMDALAAGLFLGLQGVGSLLTRWVGAAVDRTGPRWFAVIGVTLAAVATLPYVFAGTHPSLVLLGAALVVRGGALSMANVAVMSGAFRDVPRDRLPDASALVRVLQQLGGSFGTAVLATVLTRSGGATGAFGTAFLCAVALTALAVVPALLVPGRDGHRVP
ncbi:DHA2 family efflux MFS transporter permease subunit [Amycolatopsis sp. NBC_00345]|uniref:DHA2 family efflux MFS transporter permease subunit n=1 Tax=Amycolatopsis sp. NBC_00345 TaxID=2975955 RepID=UPI002E274DCA